MTPIFGDRPNVVKFESTTAKAVRVMIHAWNFGDAPCFDELEIYQEETPDNLARISGIVVSASSCIEGYSDHTIAHLNDGQYGNAVSWIAKPGDAAPWVQYVWPEPVTFDRVVFSRDRNRQYGDRVPKSLEVQTSLDGTTWQTVYKSSENAIVVDQPVRTDAYSHWYSEVPWGEAIDLVPADTVEESVSPDEALLRGAFLAEEIANLKMSGFGDVQRHLRQRHYPEFVEPQFAWENTVPLPIAKNDIDALTLNEDSLWQKASEVTVHTTAGVDRWSAGPLLSHKLSAIATGEKLFLCIKANRLLSRHLAMVTLENAGCRGLLVLTNENKVVWKWVDNTPAGVKDQIVEIESQFDPATLTTTVALPLSWFPEYDKRGLAVSLGMGGRWSEPGGHPVHLLPANFSLRAQFTKTGFFVVDLTSFADAPISLMANSIRKPNGLLQNKLADWSQRIDLIPNETKSIELPSQTGLTGPEFHLGICDANASQYELVCFRYDPCERVSTQLQDIVARGTALDPNTVEHLHFRKQIAIPGAVNPRYNDIAKELVQLANVESAQKYQSPEEADPNVKTLWDKFNILQKNRNELQSSGTATDSQIRNLFLQLRLLKRDCFLTNEEFHPLTKILFNKRGPFHPSHNYSDLFDSEWNPGGGVCVLSIPQNEQGRLEPEKAVCEQLINAGDGVIRNPSPSFDATKIFYAHRVNREEYFRIFEYDLASKEARRISADGPFHDFWPTELPDNGLAFVSTRCKKKFICWRPQAFVLHRMEKDGTGIRELSYADLTEFAPSVKDDGRLLWTRSEYVDKGADYGHTLWTIRIDGTMPELVYGNTINLPQGYANGRDVPDTREVCTIGISHFGDLNGPVLLLDTMKGPHDPAAMQAITPDVPWPGYWAPTETFREPVPISRDVILVAYAHNHRFGLWLIDRYGNREMIYQDPSIDSICPQPFQPRDVPPVLLGSINPSLAERGLGQFSIANVYRGLEGQVEPGIAKYLRICQELPTWLDQNENGTYRADHDPFEEWYAAPTDILQGAFGWPSYVAKGVIGTVEIQEDGSADFLAPANKVLFFELLDENYNEIQRMRSVIQLQAGEQRSCIGCHESRLITPEGKLTMASRNPAAELVPPPWGAGPFAFENVVQPVLDKNCVACHTPDTMAKSAKQLDLTGTRDANKIPNSYRWLIKSGTVHYFDYYWGGGVTTKVQPYSFGTFKSSLFTILKDENHKDVALTSEEEQAIKCWIDFNVPLWGDYTQRSKRP
ncbi:MAG: discoidin domain-containing protein [Planctomycetia bacterium]|nr:discoidin domain-containing protein [Planctomycetia bacterium]